MPSLAFDLLDRHIVAGRGDEVAVADESGVLTFAQLVERSAALAGGLKALGVTQGDEVEVAMEPGNLQVEVVCACVRLGAVPGGTGEVRIVESADTVTVYTPGDQHELDLVHRAGRTAPAPALPSDPPGYAASVLQIWSFLADFSD